MISLVKPIAAIRVWAIRGKRDRPLAIGNFKKTTRGC